MRDVRVTELRKHLPAFLAAVQGGEALRVLSRGKVVAHIVPPVDLAADARAASRGTAPRAGRRRGGPARRRVGRRAVSVLDTHALVFDALSPERLGPAAAQARATSDLACSDLVQAQGPGASGWPARQPWYPSKSSKKPPCKATPAPWPARPGRVSR